VPPPASAVVVPPSLELLEQPVHHAVHASAVTQIPRSFELFMRATSRRKPKRSLGPIRKG
jgi:hypothetical protein